MPLQFLQDIEQNPGLDVHDLKWGDTSEHKPKSHYKVPGHPDMDIDIQTVPNATLVEILKKRRYNLDNIPKKDSIIEEDSQSEYYQNVKQHILEQLESKKFAIVEGPTGTGKTTLIKTLAYENGLELYEVGANSDKTVEDFLKDIKTSNKNNILQITTISGPLEKAIKNGGIFLINEANSLSPDIAISLANMLESGFIISGTKKIKIHDNFKLVFTSNSGYSGVKDYNSAVKRKSGGIMNLEYEPELQGEAKIVKTLYSKIRSNLNTHVSISDDDLDKITQSVRSIRGRITKDGSLLSQDQNDFGDFLYIRLYEKIITNFLVSEKGDLTKEITQLLHGYLQEKIVGAVGMEYFSHNNPKDKLNTLIGEDIPNIIVIKSSKIVLDSDFSTLFEEIEEKILENNDFTTGDVPASSISYQKRTALNPNIFTKVLENEQKSLGETLKREEKLQTLAENIHIKILETRKEKIISDIQITQVNNINLIQAKINNQELYFGLKTGKKILDESGKEVSLKNINEENFIKYIFGNSDFNVYLEEEKGYITEHKNPFDNPKALEIRKFSKIITKEIEDKEIVTLLGFKAEPRDIRYIGEKSGKYYIPQSKANDILLKNYEAVSSESEYFSNKKEGQHLLVLGSDNKLYFIKKSDYQEGKILKLLDKNLDLNIDIDNDIRTKFSHIDEHNFRNGGQEKQQTGTPSSLGEQFPVHLQVDSILDNTPTFGENPSKTTKDTLDKIETTFKTGNDVLLTGLSGVGKSTYALDIAKKMDLPYISIQIDSDTSEDEFLGQNIFNEGLLEKQKSAFLDYYINGGVVELKELNMSGDITFLHNFLDKNGSIMFDLHTYHRHSDFHIIATVNPFDNRRFEGVGPLNLATQARFTPICIDYIDNASEETDILFNYTKIINPDLINFFGSEDNLKHFIGQSLETVVFPIRNKMKELNFTQESGTDESLKLIYSKIVTIDIYQKWLKNSKNKDDLMKYFSDFYNFSPKEQRLLPNDILNILQTLKNK